MLKQEIIEKIIKNSISLEEYGLNDLGWKREDAKNLINSIMSDRIGILGGDIYKLTPDCLEALYDNWACEPGATESEEEYYLRSKAESLKYIENYPKEVAENIVFSMVFTERFC